MTFTSSEVVEYPLAEVWRWFTSPGAMTRLTPPFMGMRVVREADNVRDGVAVLRPALPSPAPDLAVLPKWVAEHDPGAYVEHRRFLDRATSAPYRQLTGWVHDHRFEEAEGHTRVIDRVSARVPDAVLEPMFTFRTNRLRADLAALGRSRLFGDDRRVTVAMTGSSGLIGTQLRAWLTTAGHRVIRLVRSLPHGPDERRWDPDDPAPDLLDDVDVLVHLAGSSIAGRFTDAHKRKLRESRVEPTRRLAELVRDRAGQTAMVSSSAIGYYGADRGEEVLTEDSEPGEGYVAEVVVQWEDACQPARGVARVVNVRTGIVLSASGGVLGVLQPLFRLGLGGRIGDGHQWFSWVALDDLVDIYVRAILDERVAGPVNGVAPQTVRNSDFTRVMGEVLHRPTPLPVPEFAPTVLLGREGTQQLATADQRVLPTALEGLGHTFRFPHLAPALAHELGRERRA